MEINYETFERTLKEGNYADAFHILFRMIDNLDPNAIKADLRWTRIARKRTDNAEIQALEKEYRELPREKKKEIEDKFAQILESAK